MENTILSQEEALSAVAASNHGSPSDYEAWKAPKDSVHAGLWYAQERNVEEMQIDDCVWFVLPDGNVERGIPVGNPIHEPSVLDLGSKSLTKGFPPDERYQHSVVEWALRYNAYQRLAESPEQLEILIRPLREAYERIGAIPEWAGVDLLRGWAFYLQREHYHTGGHRPLFEEYPEFESILAAVNGHPDCGAGDRAPERER